MMKSKEITEKIEGLKTLLSRHKSEDIGGEEITILQLLALFQIAAELDSISYRLKQIAEKK